LLDSLWAYYALEDADESVSIRDTSGHGRHLTTDAHYNPETTTKKLGSASCDPRGTDTFPYAKNDQDMMKFGNTSFTLAGWIYNQTTVPLDFQGILARDEIGGREWFLVVDDTKKFAFYIGDGDATIESVINDDSIMAADRWYYAIAWYSLASDRIYLQVNNGVIDSATVTLTPANGTTAYFNVGTFRQYSGFVVEGFIDECAVWHRVLTAQERSDLYNSGSGKAFGTW
jgi:hypothetical protein